MRDNSQMGNVWPNTEQRIWPKGSSRCCHGQLITVIGGGHQGMLVQEPYAQLPVECDTVRHL